MKTRKSASDQFQRKKNTSTVTQDVALKALAAILSSLQLDDETENENEKNLDDTQSTIIFDDSQQNHSQSSSQKSTQNPKQR